MKLNRQADYEEALHTRYRVTYREIIDQFITKTFYRSIIYPPCVPGRYITPLHTYEEAPHTHLSEAMGFHLLNPTAFEAMGDEWHILEPPQPRAPAQTPVRSKKRKAVDPHAGGAHAIQHCQAQAQDTYSSSSSDTSHKYT